MYATQLGSQRVTLGVSGLLWQRSLIMYDRETDTQWSQLLGRAMAGPLTGTELKSIPCVMTDWTSWKQRYPETRVLWLNPTAREFTTRYMKPLGRYVLGITLHNQAHAWPLDVLAQQPIRNDRCANTDVVVTFDAESATARMFSRRLQSPTAPDEPLVFQRPPNEAIRNQMVDQQTGTSWDRISGRGLKGPLAGQYLEPLPAIMSTRAAWEKFHPSTYRESSAP